MADQGSSSRWSRDAGRQRGAAYDERWRALADRGGSIHGEAELVSGFAPATVLDAGCGTGRVAIELACRGIEVVGVDLDPSMLEQARAKAPQLTWIETDLRELRLDREFDVVVMAGNVMIFVRPGSEADVVRALAAHVAPGGVLVAGFQLGRGYDLHGYDEHCAAAGLALADRFSTWEADVFEIDSDYAVSVHVRQLAVAATESTAEDAR